MGVRRLLASPPIARDPLLPSEQTKRSHPDNSAPDCAFVAAGIVCQRDLRRIALAFGGQAPEQSVSDAVMDGCDAAGSVSCLEQIAEPGALVAIQGRAVCWTEH